MSQGQIPPILVHQVAQMMCFARHGDWRYDPGKQKHAKWFERAERFIGQIGGYEQIGHSDGMGGSHGPCRPESKSVRLVGAWVRVPRP